MTRGLSSSSGGSSTSPSRTTRNTNRDGGGDGGGGGNLALRSKLSLLDMADNDDDDDNNVEKYSTPRETAAGTGRGRSNHNNMLSARPSTFQPPPSSQQQQQQQQPYSHQPQPVRSQSLHATNANTNTNNNNNNNNNESHQAGILASGLAWVDRQREKRRRQYLQMQAEQQLLKINQATAAAAAAATVVVVVPDDKRMISKSGEGATCQLDLSDILLNNADSSSSNNNNKNNNTNYNPDSSTKSGDDSIYYDANDNSNDVDNYIYTGEDYYDATVDAPNNNFSRSEKNKKKTSMSDEDNKNATAPVTTTDNNNNNNDEDDDDDDDEFPIPPVRVERVAGDDDPNNAFILTSEQMHELACHVLPKTVAFSRWRRLYGLGRDGDSFDGCLRIIGNATKTLMVVRTSKGSIFGGYSESPWHSQAQHGDARFFGSAAACLWSFSSASSVSSPPSGDTDKNKNGKTKTIQVYKWTGKNRYIQLCDLSHKMIAFGGGGDDGAFGLCVQDDFQRGSTGPCDTFDNEPLCPDDNFDIVDVEFWEFMTGVF
eukprot:CAMPEP_0113464156 /NCGR_PEP_ID=MMETSP0014_2-20120614/13049_1 /TAXON_ID=2857 /ORGANISM="Nitzschia sp." /LENGTH=541 /DNA_ID=CAMNT_0000356215 /DNA_START=283 /DNA_END=1908 /DNA_ORIENTATION=+ /assembly_acc=CAM_ASM_000159